jgi:putative endonuclease
VNPALPKSKNWYYVYLLTSSKTAWIYIGCTNDLEKRLREHNERKVCSTKKMLPVEVIYFEAYKSKDVAFAREKSLKKYGSGLAKLKSRLGIVREGRAG